MITFYVTKWMVIYLFWYKPYENPIDFAMEILNEITSLLMLYQMLTFTNWGPEPEVQYAIGYTFAATMALNLAIHILFMLGTTAI